MTYDKLRSEKKNRDKKMPGKTRLIISSIALVVILSFIVSGFQDSGTAIGTFTIGNNPPNAASNWQPTTTHNKSQIFTWTEGTDPNTDPVSTFVFVGTTQGANNVVNSLESNPTYTFTQAESNWDYTWGVESRTYYFNLTSYDGNTNGSYYNGTFTLTDAIPTITQANSTAWQDGQQKIGDTVNFSMTSHGDTDALDNHSLRVCTQDGIGTDGECTIAEICKYPATGYTDETNLYCTELLDAGEPNSVYNASFYVCDCPPEDQSCPGQCSLVDRILFYVNHVPTQGAATMNTTETVYADEVLTCVGNGANDPDSHSTTYYYQFSNQSDVLQAFSTTSTFDCGSSSGCFKNIEINCTVRVQDQYGFNDSANDVSVLKTITNKAPPAPTNFEIQDGSGPDWDGSTYDTHDSSPNVQWTEGSDVDGDTIETYFCVANSQANRANWNCVYETLDADASISGITGLDYNGLYNTYYVAARPTDGTINGTQLNITIFINNSIPEIHVGSLSPLSFHTQTPTLSWAVSDDDDGSINHWPADSLTNHLRVGANNYGDPSYESSDTANNNSHTVDDAAIPWGTAEIEWANNSNIYYSAWVTDGNLGGQSSYYNTTLTLYDSLPDVTEIVLDNAGQAMSSCLSSTCTFAPIEGENSSLAVRVTATDNDNDCDTQSTGYLTLCLQTDHTNCNPHTNNDYYYQLDKITRSGSTCYYEFSTNKTSEENTPEFFRASDTYSLYVNISGQAGSKTTDTERNASWTFDELKSVSYSSLISVGGASPQLNQWNDGTNQYSVINKGNAILNLSWNTSDFFGPENITINGGNMFIDDDNSFSSEATGILTMQNMTKGTGTIFNHATGLELCSSIYCNDATLNESVSTYYHIYLPLGLSPGQYNSTITLKLLNGP